MEPGIAEKCANAATPPAMSARAASTSGWQPTFTYMPNEIVAGSRPAAAAASRARPSAHATRSGSAPTASVTCSAMPPANSSIRGPDAAMSSGTFGCAGAVEPAQPARGAVAVDGVAGEVALQRA